MPQEFETSFSSRPFNDVNGTSVLSEPSVDLDFNEAFSPTLVDGQEPGVDHSNLGCNESQTKQGIQYEQHAAARGQLDYPVSELGADRLIPQLTPALSAATSPWDDLLGFESHATADTTAAGVCDQGVATQDVGAGDQTLPETVSAHNRSVAEQAVLHPPALQDYHSAEVTSAEASGELMCPASVAPTEEISANCAEDKGENIVDEAVATRGTHEEVPQASVVAAEAMPAKEKGEIGGGHVDDLLGLESHAAADTRAADVSDQGAATQDVGAGVQTLSETVSAHNRSVAEQAVLNPAAHQDDYSVEVTSAEASKELMCLASVAPTEEISANCAEDKGENIVDEKVATRGTHEGVPQASVVKAEAMPAKEKGEIGGGHVDDLLGLESHAAADTRAAGVRDQAAAAQDAGAGDQTLSETVSAHNRSVAAQADLNPAVHQDDYSVEATSAEASKELMCLASVAPTEEISANCADDKGENIVDEEVATRGTHEEVPQSSVAAAEAMPAKDKGEIEGGHVDDRAEAQCNEDEVPTPNLHGQCSGVTAVTQPAHVSSMPMSSAGACSSDSVDGLNSREMLESAATCDSYPEVAAAQDVGELEQSGQEPAAEYGLQVVHGATTTKDDHPAGSTLAGATHELSPQDSEVPFEGVVGESHGYDVAATQQSPGHVETGEEDGVQASEEIPWRSRLIAVYEKHNPSKIGDVDNILVKYKGREDDVWAAICKKYALSTDHDKATERKQASCSEEPGSQADSSASSYSSWFQASAAPMTGFGGGAGLWQSGFLSLQTAADALEGIRETVERQIDSYTDAAPAADPGAGREAESTQAADAPSEARARARGPEGVEQSADEVDTAELQALLAKMRSCDRESGRAMLRSLPPAKRVALTRMVAASRNQGQQPHPQGVAPEGAAPVPEQPKEQAGACTVSNSAQNLAEPALSPVRERDEHCLGTPGEVGKGADATKVQAPDEEATPPALAAAPEVGYISANSEAGEAGEAIACAEAQASEQEDAEEQKDEAAEEEKHEHREDGQRNAPENSLKKSQESDQENEQEKEQDTEQVTEPETEQESAHDTEQENEDAVGDDKTGYFGNWLPTAGLTSKLSATGEGNAAVWNTGLSGALQTLQGAAEAAAEGLRTTAAPPDRGGSLPPQQDPADAEGADQYLAPPVPQSLPGACAHEAEPGSSPPESLASASLGAPGEPVADASAPALPNVTEKVLRELEALKAERHAMLEEHQRLRSEKQALVDECKKMRSDRQLVVEECRKREGEKQGLSDENRRMMKRVKDVEERMRDVMAESRRSEKHVKELSQAKSLLEDQVAKVSGRAATAEALADEQRDGLQSLARELERARARLQSERRQQSAAEQDRDQRTQESARRLRQLEEQLQEQAEVTGRERQELLATNSAMAAQLKRASVSLDELEGRLHKQQFEANQDAEAKRLRLEAIELDSGRQSLAYTQQITDLEARLVKQERKLADMTLARDAAEKQREEAVRAAEAHRQRLDAIEPDVARQGSAYARQAADLEARLARTEQQLSEVASARDTAEQQRDDKEAELQQEVERRRKAQLAATAAAEHVEELSLQLQKRPFAGMPPDDLGPLPHQQLQQLVPALQDVDEDDDWQGVGFTTTLGQSPPLSLAPQELEGEARRLKIEVEALERQRDALTKEGTKLQDHIDVLRVEARHIGGSGGMSRLLGFAAPSSTAEQKYQNALLVIKRLEDEINATSRLQQPDGVARPPTQQNLMM